MNKNDFIKKLVSWTQDAFPRQCHTCGKTYRTVDQYLEETHSLRHNRGGIKETYCEEDGSMVEVYRNCTCGSTLVAVFADRRDNSPRGRQWRREFNELLDILVTEHGMDKDIARLELLEFFHGRESKIFSYLSIEPGK